MASCASHSHHFEAAPVCAHDVVNYLPHHFVLYHPTPRLHVTVPPELTEVEEEFHQPELHQQVRNFMAARIWGFADVGAEVPYPYEILVLEA